MKTIIATDTEYSPLGHKKSVTLHYNDGTTKKLTFAADNTNTANKEQLRSYVGYVIHQFNLK